MKVHLYRCINKPGTEKAYQFRRRDKGEKEIWIPKSLISHVSQIGLPDQYGFSLVTVDVEDWFAEKEDL